MSVEFWREIQSGTILFSLYMVVMFCKVSVKTEFVTTEPLLPEEMQG